MRTITYLLAGSLLIALAACGPVPESKANTASSSGGVGSKTLRVNATVSSESAVPNAKDAALFTTNYFVVVRKGSADVIDAKVTIYRGPKAINVPHQGGGAYRIVEGGVPSGTVSLSVESGSDYVRGVARSAPGLHVMHSPLPAAIVKSNNDLKVFWIAPVRADEARLRVRNYDNTIADLGEQLVPADRLDASDKARMDLRRTNRQAIEGAQNDSDLTIHVKQEYTFVLQ